MHVIGVGWGNQIKANGSHIKGIFILKAYWSDALHDIVLNFVMENIGIWLVIICNLWLELSGVAGSFGHILKGDQQIPERRSHL